MTTIGRDWIIKQGFTSSDRISKLGERVAALLDDFYAGIYHGDDAYLRKADWTNPDWIEVRHHGSMSTYDSDSLTRLVFLAHDYALRIELQAIKGPYGGLAMIFYNRVRDGDLFHRHPSLESAVSEWRKRHAAPSDNESEG